MKKGKVIMLSLLVVGIWGFIGFKIIAGSDSGVVNVDGKIKQKGTLLIDSVEVFQFSFSYPDPFLKKQTAKPKVASISLKGSHKKSPIKPTQPVLDIRWDRLKYNGSMQNKSKNTTVISVSLDGNEYIVHPGDNVGDFKILNVTPDSIRVACDGNFHFVKRR